MMIEQPLAHDDIIDHAKLQEKLKTRICLDECIRSARHAEQAIEMGACRVINIKLGRVGGFSEALLVHNVARASGIDLDVRRDHPYGLYGQRRIEVPVTHYGDVMARARIRIAEAAVSVGLIQETAKSLPHGGVLTPVAAQGEIQGFSAVESPRGELCYWIQARGGRLTRCHIKSPSFQNWPAMPLAVAGNIIADFPLINKSFNLSYSGCDR
jgi:Ni,Fe-hydrogenase III large subunit